MDLGCPSEGLWEYAEKGGRDVMQPRGYTADLYKVWSSTGGLGDANKRVSVILREGSHEDQFGLFDLSGNVNQWISDSYGLYSDIPLDGQGTQRVLQNTLGCCRAAFRYLRGGS